MREEINNLDVQDEMNLIEFLRTLWQQKFLILGITTSNIQTVYRSPFILHVVANMTNVINNMKAEGYQISPEMLNRLSPYHTGHINRFGLFPLTGYREKLKVEFKLS